MGALRTYAAETIHIIDACRALATRIGGTLINVNVTSLPCESWGADTTVAIDAIHTDSMDTRAARTVIKVDFTIDSRRARLTVALVAVHQVDAATIVQAGGAVTLVDLVAADGAHVPRVADAGVGVNPVLALAVVAGIRVTVVDVLPTQHTSETCGTLALIAIRVIDALCSVQTWSTGAVININLAHWPSKTRWTETLETIDFIHTLPIVHTRVALTFIYLQFTMHTFETWHAQTCEASNLIQAGGVILAGV